MQCRSRSILRSDIVNKHLYSSSNSLSTERENFHHSPDLLSFQIIDRGSGAHDCASANLWVEFGAGLSSNNQSYRPIMTNIIVGSGGESYERVQRREIDYD